MVERQQLKLQPESIVFKFCQVIHCCECYGLILVGQEKCFRSFLYYDNIHNAIKHEQFLRQSEDIVLNSVIVYSRH